MLYRAVSCFSSLFLGIPFATFVPVCCCRSAISSFSSLFLGIPFATRIPKSDLEKAKWRFSSLFLGIPFATGKDRFYQSRKLKEFQFPFPRDSFCNWMRKAWRRSGRRRGFSSLFLGIPFATGHRSVRSGRESLVSVPFSSGFLLQHSGGREKV